MVTVDDCGSTLGSPVLINQANYKKYLGFTLIHGNHQDKIDSPETMEKYLGQQVQQRSPQYCRLNFTDYCVTCVGPHLSVNKTGLSMAASDVGNRLMGIFMAGAHAKSLRTSKMDLSTAIF